MYYAVEGDPAPAGKPFGLREIAGVAHHMHQQDPQLFASIISEFASTLSDA